MPDNRQVCYSFGNQAISINKTGEWRFLTPVRVTRLSPCRQGCLLEGQIPEWMEAVKREKWSEAWSIMEKFNPFPALTGYTCFHPCTVNCNRGQLDQTLDIREVEKSIGHWRIENFKLTGGNNQTGSRGRIAVVGSGPAGLSCAYYLNQAGYRVKVFEKNSLFGGMAALGIPEYRLPRRILSAELNILTDLGIQFQNKAALGRDFTMDELYEKYDAVFLAIGAWKPHHAGIPGEDHQAVWDALDFLTDYNTGGLPEVNGPVLIIGGGNAAIDSARSALRLPGVHQVSLVYRRSRIEMPAAQEEVEAAEGEGVELIFNAAPRRIEFSGNRLKEVVFDRSRTGLSSLVIEEGKSIRKSCATVILALGQNPDLNGLGLLNKERPIFAGGDMVSGPATVPEAIRAGRIAAASIIDSLKPQGIGQVKGQTITSDLTEQPVSFEELNLAASMNLMLLERQADPVAEAERCLGCGTCNSCGICYLFCPDLAVDQAGGRFEFNLDYCKGCGICVRECPARALSMEGGN